MTEEIINSDGSRNWQANILLDNVKRLEQENKELKKERDILLGQLVINDGENITVQISQSQFEQYNNYHSALEEINKIAEPRFVNGLNEEADLCNLAMDRIQNKINEVLNENKADER